MCNTKQQIIQKRMPKGCKKQGGLYILTNLTNPIDFWEKIIYYESNVHGHVRTDKKQAACGQLLLGKPEGWLRRCIESRI